MENEERNIYVFIWKIENYSYSWHQVNEYIASPRFEISSVEYRSFWRLKLYPRGKLSRENFTSLYLERASGDRELLVDFEFSLLKSDGTPEYNTAGRACLYAEGSSFGFEKLVCREEIIQMKKSIFLPEDTLTVQCRINVREIKLHTSVKAFAKSTVLVHQTLSLWDAGEFNYLWPCEQGIFKKLSFEQYEVSLELKDDFIYANLVINDVTRMFRIRIGVLDSSGSTSQFIIDEYMFHSEKQFSTNILASRSNLLQRKDFYLLKGHIILYSEYNYSYGAYYTGQIVCHAFHKIFTSYILDKKENSKDNPPSITRSRCCDHNCDSLKNDFENLYQEGTLCDFTIRVRGEKLKVHKAVLCARSSVFKSMLTTNMKEANENMVDISDLEIDTVRRMVTFMYTDKADDLNWEVAKELYSAADKYDIEMLKRVCTEFLKINLIAANVDEIRVLANTHEDEDLKEVASKFLQIAGDSQASDK